jgi:hypothetical protein
MSDCKHGINPDVSDKICDPCDCEHKWEPVCYGIHSYCKKCNSYREYPCYKKEVL